MPYMRVCNVKKEAYREALLWSLPRYGIVEKDRKYRCIRRRFIQHKESMDVLHFTYK